VPELRRAGSATVPERDSSLAIPIMHRSGLPISLRFENLVPGFVLVFASNGPRRGVGRNALFAHQPREVRAPISQALLVDVEPPAELELDQFTSNRTAFQNLKKVP